MHMILRIGPFVAAEWNYGYVLVHVLTHLYVPLNLNLFLYQAPRLQSFMGESKQWTFLTMYIIFL